MTPTVVAPKYFNALKVDQHHSTITIALLLIFDDRKSCLYESNDRSEDSKSETKEVETYRH